MEAARPTGLIQRLRLQLLDASGSSAECVVFLMKLLLWGCREIKQPRKAQLISHSAAWEWGAAGAAEIRFTGDEVGRSDSTP